MNKEQLVDEIREYNTTAGREFLWSFNDEQLDSYLQRLKKINNHRGPESVWIRPDGSPATDFRRSA